MNVDDYMPNNKEKEPQLNILEIANIVQSAIAPLSNKVQSVDDKVNLLNQDRVTRTDFEKLRQELHGSMVPRDVYETRHSALIERDAQLESSIRELRRDHEEDMKSSQAQHQQEMQRIHDRIESGKQQFEARIKEAEQSIENAQEKELTSKDRFWIRVSQAFGIIAIILSLIEILLGHVHFS